MRHSRGFSLIELLTVIAIIGILAAIIFPVMGSARDAARRTQCISNMNQIQQALKLYKNDNNRYPPVLVGFVEMNGSTPVPMDNIQHGFLFREYVKGSAQIFHCPNNQITGMTVAMTDPMAGNQFVGPSTASTPLIGADRPAGQGLYVYDSYDAQLLSYDRTVLQPRYTLAWANAASDVGTINPAITDPLQQQLTFSRQLKFRSPPDNTVVTWCSYHRGGDEAPTSGMDLVLFLDGHVDRIPATQMYPQGTSTNPAYPYTISPNP